MLAVLADSSSIEGLHNLARAAAEVPSSIAYFAAGEVDVSAVLADIFSLMSAVRLASTEGSIAKENTLILIDEYEALAEKLGSNIHLSPFASADDFAIPSVPLTDDANPLLSSRLAELSLTASPTPIKDIYKGHDKTSSKTQRDRSNSILEFVRNNKNVSIKDISKVIRGCSEKTIQRELSTLIAQGLIKKMGERRWSVYVAVLGA